MQAKKMWISWVVCAGGLFVHSTFAQLNNGSKAFFTASNPLPTPTEYTDTQQAKYVTPTTQELVREKKTPALKKAKEPVQPTHWVKAIGVPAATKLRINGFMSAGVSQSNAGQGVNYDVPSRGSVNREWNFAPNSLVGLQLSAKLTNWADVVSQFTASGNETQGNRAFSVYSGWAFFRIKQGTQAQLRVGRFRMPLFLYSDTQQVGYTYPWMFLPSEVYRVVPFQNMNGVSYLYSKPLAGSQWSLSFQPFLGANSSDYEVNKQLIHFKENEIVGTSVMLGDKNFTLHGAYAHVKITGTGPDDSPVVPKSDANFYSVGTKFNWGAMFVVAEYAKRDVPDQLAVLQGYYATLGVHMGKLLASFTYAKLRTDNTPITGGEPRQAQQSFTGDCDYYINANMVVKSSVSYIKLLNNTSGLFDGDPGKQGLMVYGAELDAIF